MSNHELNRAILSLRPGQGFVLRGDTVDGIEWLNDGVAPVSQSEAEAEIARLAVQDEAKAAADAAATSAAISHAKSLGFTDEMVAVMYPGLNSPAI